MVEKSKEARDQAEARFRKAEDRTREGKKAMAEHEAAGKAVREKTARLRSERLAKEAADLAAQPAPVAKPAGKKG